VDIVRAPSSRCILVIRRHHLTATPSLSSRSPSCTLVDTLLLPTRSARTTHESSLADHDLPSCLVQASAP